MSTIEWFVVGAGTIAFLASLLKIWNLVKNVILSTIKNHIDDIVIWFCSFIARTIFDSVTTSIRIGTSIFHMDILIYQYTNGCLWKNFSLGMTDEYELLRSTKNNKKTKSKPYFGTPSPGTKIIFMYDSIPILVKFDEVKSSSSHDIVATIIAPCSFEKISEFMTEVNDVANRVMKTDKSFGEMIQLVTYDTENESVSGTYVDVRPFNTIFLPEGMEEEVLQLVDSFVESEEEMSNRNIPHRMGIMLEGVPGSGKTSLVRALATHYEVPILSLNLNEFVSDGFTDSSILTGLKEGVELIEASRSSFVIALMEDISAINDVVAKTGGRGRTAKKDGVSMSGLLNAIDGVGTPNHILFVFTANEVKDLDPALLRTGRIDKVFKFDYATESQIRKFYQWFYPLATTEQVDRFLAAFSYKRVSMSDVYTIARLNWRDCEKAIETATSFGASK